MVPVKFLLFDFYYKQKIRRVMKKFLFFIILLICFGINAAQAQYSYPAGYLANAAKAWAGIFSNLGPSGEVVAYIKDVQESDISAFMNTVSILAFNSTAISLFETRHHINQAFDVISSPMIARRNKCVRNLTECTSTRKNIVIGGQVFGAFADYDSNYNGDFKTRNTGFYVNAKGAISDGWQIGLSYTRSLTDTKDDKVYTDATSNSITMFSEYLANNGFFINMGINGGHTTWASDKTIAGVSDDSSYDTEFLSGQVNTGFRMYRGRITMVPQIGVRYSIIGADEYTDAVAQSFDSWWYNSLTGFMSLNIGFDFIGSDFIIRPDLRIGGSYDAINRGTQDLRVQLINGAIYDIPIEKPNRTALNAGASLNVYGEIYSAGISYMFDMRSGYISNTLMANLKIAF